MLNAIKKYSFLIVNEIYCLLVKRGHLLIQDVPASHRTYKVQLNAVNYSGLSIQDIENQTPEICLAAVNYTGFALNFVKQQTPELCLAAVKQNGMYLRFVRNQTPEICLAAIYNDASALEYVKDKASIALLIDDEFIESNLNQGAYSLKANLNVFVSIRTDYLSIKELKANLLMINSTVNDANNSSVAAKRSRPTL